MTEYPKQHLMTKYYEIIRLNTEKIAEVAGADSSFAFMWLPNLPWPAKLLERMLVSELGTLVLQHLSVFARMRTVRKAYTRRRMMLVM